MQKIDFYLSGKLCPPPDNWQSLQMELSFEDGSPEGTLNAQQLIWKAENAAILNQWINSGIVSGGVGIFEGIPLVIKICDTQDIAFNGIIDLTDPDTRFNCDIIKAKIRDKRMDMVTQLFDSISFAYLATPLSNGGAGIINPKTISNGGDYFVIPYQRINSNEGLETMITLLTIYEAIEMFEKIYHEVIALVDATLGATAAVGFGAVVAAVVELLAWLTELVVMIFVLFKLLTHFMEEITGHIPSFNKLGMYAITLCERACQYFGLKFSSSILSGTYKDLVVMPSKCAWENNRKLSNIVTSFFTQLNVSSYTRMNYDDEYNLNHGGDSYGYFDGTIGSFFRALEDVFDAKSKIIFDKAGMPVLHFEVWNYQYNLSQYTLPNISDQSPFPQSFGTNASELPANYLLEYAIDDSDLNTKLVFEGTSCYAQTQPLKVNIQQNVLLRNLVEKRLIFSLGLMKRRLNLPEHIFNALWNLVVAIPNAVIGALITITGIVNKVLKFLGLPTLPVIKPLPINPLSSRLGNLLITNDITNNPKLLMCLPNGNLYPDNKTSTDILAARVLFKNFHYTELALTVDPNGNPYTNQWRTYPDQEIPLCCEEYNLIKNNNYIRTFDGDIAKATSVKWNMFKSTARIDYRINKVFTNNLKTSFVIDGSQTTSAL